MKIIKINLFKYEFVSNQEGKMMGVNTGEVEDFFLVADKILGFKPIKNKDGTENCYVLVLDMPEPLHVKDTFNELNYLINPFPPIELQIPRG